MIKDNFNLQDKTAIVTGGSRGIGEAIARYLADQGAHVIVSSRKLEGCQAVAESIISDGGKAEAKACHIGELDQIQALFDHLDQSGQKIDILVNNAAANPYYGHIIDTDLRAFQKTVDVNIRGYFYMSVGAAKRMRESGGGSIINVASVNGICPGNKQGIYSITKAAVISMTKAFAKECAPDNVRVNAIIPGLTETKFASTLHSNEDILRKALQAIPLGRIAQPNEMAAAALYLASSASSYMTGSCLTVDGGLLNCGVL